MLVNQRLKIFARHSYLELCWAVEIVVATSNLSGENKTDWGCSLSYSFCMFLNIYYYWRTVLIISLLIFHIDLSRTTKHWLTDSIETVPFPGVSYSSHHNCDFFCYWEGGEQLVHSLPHWPEPVLILANPFTVLINYQDSPHTIKIRKADVLAVKDVMGYWNIPCKIRKFTW